MTAERWSFAAEAPAPALARAAIRAFAGQHGVDASTLISAALCVSEAVTNVVVHASRGAPAAGTVAMEAEVADSALRIVVGDDGHGLQPRLDSPGLGLGLPIIS